MSKVDHAVRKRPQILQGLEKTAFLANHLTRMKNSCTCGKRFIHDADCKPRKPFDFLNLPKKPKVDYAPDEHHNKSGRREYNQKPKYRQTSSISDNREKGSAEVIALHTPTHVEPSMGSEDGAEQRVPRNQSEAALSNVEKMEFSSRAHEIQAGLIDTFLKLDLIDNNLYLARHLLTGRKSSTAVYGGQVIGQALAAAAATVSDGLIPTSLHCYFIKTGDVSRPILYMIDRIRDGRTFCTRLVKAVQQGEAIFTMQMSFQKPEPDGITYQMQMPRVPPPEELQDARPLMEEALRDDSLPTPSRLVLTYKLNEIPPAFDRVFSFRPVDADSWTMRSSVPEEPRSAIWLKANENIGDDPRLHQCVAAYISDFALIETAMRPACATGFMPSMALSLDHTMWMHDPHFRVDEWMLYETVSTISRGARSFIEGRLWTRDGRLILSCCQEGLIRAPKHGTPKPKPAAPQ